MLYYFLILKRLKKLFSEQMHISPPPFHFIRIQWGLYFFILRDTFYINIFILYNINLYFPSVYLNTHVRIINQRRNLSYTFSLHQLYFFHYFLTQFNNTITHK